MLATLLIGCFIMRIRISVAVKVTFPEHFDVSRAKSHAREEAATCSFISTNSKSPLPASFPEFSRPRTSLALGDE